jgi:hypothetical protein
VRLKIFAFALKKDFGGRELHLALEKSQIRNQKSKIEEWLGQMRANSPLVNIVRANVHGHNAIAFEIKHGPQIGFNIHRIDRSSVMRGKAVNLVRTETRVKRVLLKNLPSPPR